MVIFHSYVSLLEGSDPAKNGELLAGERVKVVGESI